MKQIQPFQKHWLQITSIVVCRLNLAHVMMQSGNFKVYTRFSWEFEMSKYREVMTI